MGKDGARQIEKWVENIYRQIDRFIVRLIDR